MNTRSGVEIYKVLLVDNDKQGDCSRGMNRRTQDGEGIDRIMVDRHPDMEKLINKTDYLHLDIITATAVVDGWKNAASRQQKRRTKSSTILLKIPKSQTIPVKSPHCRL